MSAILLDAAAGRRSVTTHTWLETRYVNLQRENVRFVEPPNSPDLSPIVYAVWSALQQMVYHRQSFASVDELKKQLSRRWRNYASRSWQWRS